MPPREQQDDEAMQSKMAARAAPEGNQPQPGGVHLADDAAAGTEVLARALHALAYRQERSDAGATGSWR